ncbi:glycosyltransferase family 2 protein [Myxococcota bacterium]|nr:glycosyltransferase family 2 protein [Myxococcota bacterium]
MSPRLKPRKPRRPGKPGSSVAQRPLLSLAMMVKDEERFLEAALASAREVVDELIVVDTGSTDRTVEIARDMGAVVSHFPWRDDFSAARNETLRRATGAWILVLDADERLCGAAMRGLRPHLKPGPHAPYEGFALKVTNTRLDGAPLSSFFSTRIFPNDPRLGYAGRVHNQLGGLEPGAPPLQVSRYLGLEIVHLGYDPEIYAARRKAARSLPLIEAVVAREPDNLQYRFYLGREYLLADAAAAAAEVLEATLAALLAGASGPLAETVHTLVDAYAALDRPLDGLAARFAEAARRAPGHPDVLMALALATPQPAARAAILERALGQLSHDTTAQIHLKHHPWLAWERLGHARWDAQRYPEALAAYLEALAGKPEASEGWPRLLNNLCALAIELGHPRKDALLDRLLDHPIAPLGMFFFEVERLAREVSYEAARARLRAAQGRCSRLTRDPEYAPLLAKLEGR